MAKNAVSDWSTNDALNTDIGGTNIAEGCAPGGMNDMGRKIMAQIAAFITNATFGAINLTGLLSGTTANFSGFVTTTGGIGATTPTTGTTGAVQIRANGTSGYGYLQATDNAAATEWGNFRFDASGLAIWSGAGGFNVSGPLKQAGNQVWHQGNLTNLGQLTNGPGYITGITGGMVTMALGYTPANKAGDAFTGNIGAPNVTTTGTVTAGVGVGAVNLAPGTSANTGSVGFYNLAGTRQGFVGFATTNGPILYKSDTGAGHLFQGGGITASSPLTLTGMFPITVYEVDGNGNPWTYEGFNTATLSFAWVIRGTVVKQLNAGGFY